MSMSWNTKQMEVALSSARVSNFPVKFANGSSAAEKPNQVFQILDLISLDQIWASHF